jgi:hypothetical protein
MSTSLSFKDFIEINQPQIAEMQRVADSFADPEMPGASETFSKQVRLIEGVLTQTYGVATAIARKTADLKEVAEIWELMGLFCNSVLHTLAALRHKFPSCGTPQLYDLALDYKLACDKRYKGVLEERTCLTMEFPKGLLPEPT